MTEKTQQQLFDVEEVKSETVASTIESDMEKIQEENEKSGISGSKQYSKYTPRHFQMMVRDYNQKIDAVRRNKKEQFRLYNQMIGTPEVADAIDEATDEGINYKDGKCCELEIDNEKVAEKDKTRENIQKEFNELMFDTININDNAWMWFREFLVYAELFLEQSWDESNKGKGITDVKKHSNRNTYAIFKKGTGKVISFAKLNGDDEVMAHIPPGKIAYTNSGVYDIVDDESGFYNSYKPESAPESNGQLKLFKSYIERGEKAFNALRQIEDSLVIYRLNRATERLIFNIDVGDMPPNKAEAYVKRMMQDYKTDLKYDSSTGTIKGGYDAKSILENYFVPKTSDGKGTDINKLQGGENLGKIEDIKYFLRKLYRSMKVPVSRMEPEYKVKSGAMNDMTRQEIKFGRFVRRQIRKFTKAFRDIFFHHLVLKGYVEKFDISRNDLNINFFPSNLFWQMKEMDIMKKRGQMFQTFASYAGKIFANEFLLKKYLDYSDEEIKENKELLEKQKEEEGNDGGRRF